MAPTETYPDGRIETGDTAFRTLTDRVDAVVRIRTTELHHPLSASSVEVADPADVEGIARQAHAPILCRDDGWQGVVTDDVLYWTPPPELSAGSGARR